MTEPLTFRLRHMFACACKEPAEAAARIEKLEAALRVIVQVWDTDQPLSIAKAALARDAARKALEGENG